MPMTNLTSPIFHFTLRCASDKTKLKGAACVWVPALGWGNAELFPSELSPPRWPCSPHRTTRASVWLTCSFSGTWGRLYNESTLHWALHFVKRLGQLHRVWIRCSTYDGEIFTPHHPGLCLPSHRTWAQKKCALIRKTAAIYTKQESPEKTPLPKQTYLEQL